MTSVARVLDVVHRLSPRCREAARVISYSAEQRPALLDRIGVFLHVLICTPCRRYRQSVMFLKQKLKQLAELPEPDPGQVIPSPAKARIRAALEAAETQTLEIAQVPEA